MTFINSTCLSDNINGNHSFSVFCHAGIESIDIPRILSQKGGEAVYPLPRIRSLEVHSKLNLAALLFAVKSNHFLLFRTAFFVEVKSSKVCFPFSLMTEYERWRQFEK